jgi:RimJ/RimL family protein N-acetyltransferase
MYSCRKEKQDFMSTTSLPDDFQIPAELETDRFRLRMLSVEDVELDYEAVMSSREHLRSVFGPSTSWPQDSMTLEQDLADLRWHQNEFEKRLSFAYTVMKLDESQCLGCVYIYPTDRGKSAYDVHVYLWVRQSELEHGLDALLLSTVKEWVTRVWPFQKVAYPGRDIDWETWKILDYTWH